MYRLWIDERYCKGCLICVDVCPHKALASAPEINAKVYILPIEEDMKQCKGCGICESMCPDFAIAVEEVDEKR